MMDPPSNPRPAGSRSADPTARSSLSGLRLLLVEDSPENQRFLSFLLRKRGAEVTIVANGRLGVEALTDDGTIIGSVRQPSPFDMVLMDMQMPEMDGYTATALLRKKGCRVPILAVTAHAMTADRTTCLEAGCDEYLTKPVLIEELERKILHLTGRVQVSATS